MQGPYYHEMILSNDKATDYGRWFANAHSKDTFKHLRHQLRQIIGLLTVHTRFKNGMITDPICEKCEEADFSRYE